MNNAKPTFYNLPKERQKYIADVAIKEFVKNDYRNVSLSSIIKKLNLAKGSFYRYFDSKKDLYLYLLNYATKDRYDEIDNLSNALPESLEELLIINFQNKIKFDKNNPLYSGFIYQVMREMGTPELSEITRAIKKQILEITSGILNNYAQKKKLNTVDVDIAAWTIVQVQFSIYEYLRLQYDLDFLKNIEQGKPVFGEMADITIQVVSKFARILSNGISKN